jgi:hypothetical protein
MNLNRESPGMGRADEISAVDVDHGVVVAERAPGY